MKINFKVYRLNKEKSDKVRYDSFPLDVEKTDTILYCLNKIRDENDSTLTFRHSCKSAMCGSCSVLINNKPMLACKTKIHDINFKDEILIEPLKNYPVIKDLVVDYENFWKRIKAIRPWLVKGNKELMDEKINDNCILCSCCDASCDVVPADSSFVGPAAIVSSYRFIQDPRDNKRNERLKMLVSLGLWKCAHAYECIDICPKGIAPAESITALRQEIVGKRIKNFDPGFYHAKVIYDSIWKYGSINETYLFLLSRRLKTIFNLPYFLKLKLKKKAPPLSPQLIKNLEEIRWLYKKK